MLSPKNVRIVSIGGGTGLSHLLLGLKQFVGRSTAESSATPAALSIQQLTAVVTVTDDGGSSGRLREEFQILPPGDIRKCMVALSEDELLMSRLFQYRFSGEGDLRGHSFGNLFLTALTGVTGDFLEAIRLCSEVLAIKGRILPSTMADIHLVAKLENGTAVLGESLIGRAPERIRNISIFPEASEPLPETLEAIDQADIITLGPGSLFTSLLPNLLVNGIPEAIRRSRALKVYIGNIMTQRGETLGFSMADHVEAICKHVGSFPFNILLCNHSTISEEQKTEYLKEQADQSQIDFQALSRYGVWVVTRDLLGKDKKVRHDPKKLARSIFEIGYGLKHPESLLGSHVPSSIYCGDS